MAIKKQKSRGKKLKLYILFFFRHFPALPYILKWLFISAFLAILTGSASAGFLQSLNWATAFRESHLWLILGLPLCGLVIGLLYHYYGKGIEGGNTVLLDTILHPKETIPFRMAPLVYIGTMATHLFGGSAGREGTALQMAGALADQFSKPLRLKPADRKILIIAAIAGGFGSIFGTPLAGAVFSLEVFLVGRLRYNALFPAFATAIMADRITRFWQVGHTHFHIPVIPDISAKNILYAVLAGIAFGICAASFSKAMHAASALFKSTIKFPPLRPFVGGILLLIAIWSVDTTKYIGLGIPTLLEAFDHVLPVYDFALKMIFTILTLSAGFKGGEVTPLFFIGAALGNTLSNIIPLPPGLLSGMGFVAVFAGATNTPLACMLMAIELFGSGCGIYAAMACIVAYLLSGNNSIYSNQVIHAPKHQPDNITEL